MNLPAEFCREMEKIENFDLSAFEQVFTESAVRSLRIDPNRIDSLRFEEIFPGKLMPLPYQKNAYYFDYDGIGNSFLHHGGAIYIQEPAAMTPVAAVEIPKGAWVLDLCASPGGKSLQAASEIGEDGIVVSNEFTFSRLSALEQNVERCGLKNSVITSFDARGASLFFGAVFDLVIVDAPCSGEGMMRKNPSAVSEWTLGEVRKCAACQRDILESAAETVAPGGTLLYSTCTYNLEENEKNVLWFLDSHPDFFLIPAKESVQAVTLPGIPLENREELKLCRRFYPWISPGEGQFSAILKRRGQRAEKSPRPEKTEKKKKNEKKKSAEFALCSSFLREVLREVPNMELVEEKDGFYLVPPLTLPKEKVIHSGVKVGTVRKGRVVPHHRFFMAFGQDFTRCISLSAGDERIEKFLRGETFPTSQEDGWAAVLAEGCPLGGVKITGGTAKNFYPKGLRKN